MATYKCMGRDRTDDDGKPACDYEADRPWPEPGAADRRCPKCRGTYSCKKFGVDSNEQKKRVTAADALGAVIERTSTGIPHFDHVMSGGLAKNHAILLAGPKGSGKSTLTTMLLDSFSKTCDRSVVLLSAEEYTDAELALCNRIGAINDRIEIVGCDKSTDIHTAIKYCREQRRALAVFNSLQAITFEEMPASARRDVAVAAIINDYCKSTHTPCVVMNHMSKSLEVTGSTTVGHYFDTELEIHHYNEQDDGKARKNFSDATLNEINLKDVRVLIVGKIRGGESGRKAFFLTTAKGLVPLEPRPAEVEEAKGRRRFRF